MPTLSVSHRSEDTSSDSLSPSSSSGPIFIAGIALAAAIILALIVWLVARTLRKRARSKREDKLGAAFLSVRGLVKDDANHRSPETVHVSQSKTFSREQLTKSIVLPDKVVARPSGFGTNEDILNFHRQSGTFPKPFSFALNPSPRLSSLPADSNNPRSSIVRNSFMSSSTISRYSVLSSSGSSVASSPTTGTSRKIRQVFCPVLPDELVVVAGERLLVMQSFDDGWCVVGRENNAILSTAKSLFKPDLVESNNIELGVVPAWCFLKPVKGLRAERPVRSTSLGITVQMEAPGFSSRDEIISWSNF